MKRKRCLCQRVVDDVRAWLLPILDAAIDLEEAMRQLRFVRQITDI